MFNAEKPGLDDLPSSAQLLRSTIVAAAAAAAILTTVVLPAEYGIDPTGAGRLLGLTEMGEIKQELADEELQDRQTDGRTSSRFDALDAVYGMLVGKAHAAEQWRDVVTFTLKPGASAEVKLSMEKGDTARYAWAAKGGRINFDLHAHGGGQSVTYKKGRGKTEGAGGFTAPFPGDHGWFWRNRDKQDVTVVLQLRGAYAEVKETY